MSHGVDVNKTRIDDLDRIVLRDSLTEPFTKQNICNIGCGESSLSLALCGLGHFVYNYDRRDLHSFFSVTQELFRRQKFTQIDIEKLKKHNLPKTFEVVVFQRVLHYLSYEEAKKILELVSQQISSEGKIYLSLTGMDSQIGRGYSAKKEPIDSRMGTIAKQDQEDFNITEPLCLYTEEEAIELIKSVGGLETEQRWVSQFGNIKMVLTKTDSGIHK